MNKDGSKGLVYFVKEWRRAKSHENCSFLLEHREPEAKPEYERKLGNHVSDTQNLQLQLQGLLTTLAKTVWLCWTCFIVHPSAESKLFNFAVKCEYETQATW